MNTLVPGLLAFTVILMTGCTAGDPVEASGAAPSTAQSAMSIQATGAQPPAAEANPSADDLAANAWQLVKIMSMDDSVFEPQDASVYTLTFSAEGSVAIQADCNRAKGGWSSTRRGHVEFGPLAASRALCSPDSLSARYLSQFPYVRSYVIRNGHLFLATLADGAIIEFAPGVTASQTL